MRRLTLLTVFIFLSFTPKSQAGFEWVPPQENPQKQGMNDFDINIDPPDVMDKMITPIYQMPRSPSPVAQRQITNSASNSIMQQYETPKPFQSVVSAQSQMRPSQYQSAAVPSLSNRSGLSSLSTFTAPNYYAGGISSGTREMMRPALSPNKGNSVSLYIDPFPMGQESVNSQAREMRPSSIEQAMMERGGQVHPMMMGENLHTGAQMAYTNQPTVMMPENNPISGMSPSSMTPVGSMGSLQSGPMNATAIRNFVNAEGFGSDLPLALALNQVIPAGFTHSFALGVDPGTTVTWQGGKPWDQVLDDMLRPQGLTALIKQNNVTVQPIMQL